MANKDLFKQAIAEAKSIREAAIANAKEALEESLTPHLKDMLAAKLQEMEDSKVEEEVVNEVEEEVEEAVETNEETVEEAKEDEMDEAMHSDDEDKMEESDVVEAEDDSEESEDEAEGEEEAEAEEEDEDIEVKDMEVDDLKNLIRDIIAQEMGDGGEEELDGMDMDAGAEMEPAMDDMEAGAEDDEIDLDELLAELESATNEEIEEEVTEEVNEEEVKEEEVVTEEEVKEEDNSELTEALATIETLQNQLQEVNLLNAKLMYVNKVFKANNLSESQKVNIIAAFDKAETVKEVKLVFETVSESVVTKKATKVNESKLGMASKPTGTTAAKPEVISEVSNAVRRMQKLAGII